jgi:hypothetical protein
MACPQKSACELFPLISGSGALNIWQSYYCDGNFEGCKRYQSTLDGEKIPITLLPNGKTLDIGGLKKTTAEKK